MSTAGRAMEKDVAPRSSVVSRRVLRATPVRPVDLTADPAADPAIDPAFDPRRPVPASLSGRGGRHITSRHNQRQRRSEILASIRRLLIANGCDGVTMRRIAEDSGHAVQTIYNLVGPHDVAIIEAISEYTRYVGRTAAHDPADPEALVRIIDRWVLSIEAQPAFCRQVSLIQLSSSRVIFRAIRDRQVKGMLGLLVRQQHAGVIRADAPVRDLADQLVTFAAALCVDWADQPFPLPELQRRLRSSYGNLLAGVVAARPRAPAI